MAPVGGPEMAHAYAHTVDGAKLSYYTIGSGPSILILHGAVTFALSHKDLAILLSPYFTVHTASRRGRGLSDPYPKTVTGGHIRYDKATDTETDTDNQAHRLNIGNRTFARTYSKPFAASVLATELVDLEALLQATGAKFVIAVSSGAAIALYALLNASFAAYPCISALERLIIFEPPMAFTDVDCPGDPFSELPRFEDETAAGESAKAMVTAMRAAQLGPSWVPRWLMTPLAGMMMRGQETAEEKRVAVGGQDQGVCTMKGLGPLLRYDFAIAEGMVGHSARFASLAKQGKPTILLLSGDRSPAYLKDAIRVLGESMTAAHTEVLHGAGHEVLCGPEMRGQPSKAVGVIREFFS